ncbi:GSCOCT00008800001.3-RA-CDS, partial [Cotesia congregata]
MILPYSFGILRGLGLWKLENITGWKKYLQIIYSYFWITIVSCCVFFELLAITEHINDVQQFVDSSIILLTMIAICGKMFNVLARRKEIIHLLAILQTYPCCYQDDEEKNIQDKYDKTINLRTIVYLGLTESAVTMVLSVSMLNDIPNRALAYNVWVPYDPTTSIGYFVTYGHQFFAHFVGASVNAAFDTLVPSLILKINCQLSILEHRINLISKNVYNDDSLADIKKNKEISEISKCVDHHLKIFQLVEILNKIFSSVIFLQFSISTIVICVTVYRLSQIQLSHPEFIPTACYFICMLLQVFIICLASSECSFKSYDIVTAVYQTNWYILSVSSQKSLLLIMRRSLRPLKFTAGSFVEISLNTYNQLVKLSYSAYNVLQ